MKRGRKPKNQNREFQNISCLRLIVMCLCREHHDEAFQNISCLRLISEKLKSIDNVDNFKTFHVYG